MPKYRAAGCCKPDQRVPPVLELHNTGVVGARATSLKPDTGEMDTRSQQASEALRYCKTTTYLGSTRSGMAIGEVGRAVYILHREYNQMQGVLYLT
jgi:hypothetical protein